MVIAGILFVIVGVVLFFVGKSQSAKAQDIGATETSTVAALSQRAKDVAGEIGTGSFTEYAELKGKAVAESPLRAEFSGTECVWYSSGVTREYEEEYWETDKDGNKQRRTRRGSESVSSITRDPPFFLEDETGRIRVEPDGASIDAEKSHSSFQQGAGSGGSIRLGSFTLDIGSFMTSGSRRTLGYRFEESCIPVGRQLYALGEASDQGGQLRLHKPGEKGKRFLISIKSEEQILSAAKSSAKWMRIGAIACAALGVILAVAGIFAG